MTRLDENRAKAQLAHKAGVDVTTVTNMTIWGNHSATQYPDFYNAKIDGRAANEVIGDETWLKEDFISTVQQRGAAIIKARGSPQRLGRECGDRYGALFNNRYAREGLAQRRGLFGRQLRRRERLDRVLSDAREKRKSGRS